AFQQIFIAAPKRFQLPPSDTHYWFRAKRLIAVSICSLLIGTGFYTTPWVHVIDQNVLASMDDLNSSHHGIQQSNTVTVPVGAKGEHDE
ncbi:MAG: hypothetical protein NTW90_04625, partial [Nitrosospira sp.]|nr:hypothetical protein [Nitrosospira sp.]